jgi:hypothetical protein
VRRHPPGSSALAGPPEGSLAAAVQPLLEHVQATGSQEPEWVDRAWELYESPEVRFACRQYSNAFGQAKLVLGRREVVGRDPIPVDEPQNEVESKAYELLQSFAGGPEGQSELLDRMGTYFVVPGDMVLVGAYDPARMADGGSSAKFARWDVWSRTEVRWDGSKVRIRTEATEDRFQEMPDWIRHTRIWNRHPRRGWEADSPVRASLKVLELIGLYDDRLAAEALSRLIGAGVWMIPQGMKLPTSTGDPAGGTPNDFLRLLMDVASAAIKDKRGPAATVPVLIEAAAEDIAAAKDGHHSFSSSFDERIGDLQERAIRRWATGVDMPAEVMLGLSQATHWNASLISEEKVQSFIVPSLRRACGNLTTGWLRPALQQFGMHNPGLVLWFDPAGIKTHVDLSDETQWASDRFMVGGEDTRYNLGLSQTGVPEGEDLKRQMLLHMARMKPETVPYVLGQLGLGPEVPFPTPSQGGEASGPETAPGATPAPTGIQGPQPGQERQPPTSPGRAAGLSTRGA